MFNEEIDNLIEEIEELEEQIAKMLHKFLLRKNVKFENIEALSFRKDYLQDKVIKLIEKDYVCYNKITIN